MFLPLEECDPHISVAVCREYHADEFPGLRAQIAGRGFKLLFVPSPFHPVLPLRHRHGFDVERKVLGLRVVAGPGWVKTAGHGRQRDVKGTRGRRGQGGKNNSGGTGASGGDLGNDARGQA